MATTVSTFVSPFITVADQNGIASVIEAERIEHHGGEVSVFFKAEDFEGERVYVSASVESAKELRDWLIANLPE